MTTDRWREMPRLMLARTWVAASVAVIAFPLFAVQPGDSMHDLTLKSTAFQPGGPIPRKYSCQGDDVSPPLSIAGIPAETESLALVVEDPDAPAGTWDHWILYGLSPGTSKIREATVPPGARQGRNGWGRNTWGGPCPPSGEHRYFFRLYALDTALDLAPGATKRELRRAMEGHVLAESELMGRYRKE